MIFTIGLPIVVTVPHNGWNRYIIININVNLINALVMINQILYSRYKIISQLGAGVHGETFIAEDLHLNFGSVLPRYLVKRLKPDLAVDEVTIRLFQREAHTLYELSKGHDQLPKVVAYFQEQSDFYLVQELIFGHDLRQEFKPGKQCEERYVIKLLYDLLNVLSFVHQKMVIHRDIKPANIMRRQGDGKLFLIDFGAVKQVKQQTLLRELSILKLILLALQAICLLNI